MGLVQHAGYDQRMIHPFLLGVAVLLTVAGVGVWICLEFCKALRERKAQDAEGQGAAL